MGCGRGLRLMGGLRSWSFDGVDGLGAFCGVCM
jgi:hypothetical protein